jgi:hypothetical protein
MPKITFRGAYIRYADLRYREEAGAFVRIHLTSDFTDEVKEKMEWTDVPKHIESCKLEGVLRAKFLVLEPNEKELRKFPLEIELNDASDFQLAPIRNDDGDIMRHQLRFQASSSQKGAIAAIEAYIERMGTHVGKLVLDFEKQEKLDLQPAKEETEEPEQIPLSESIAEGSDAHEGHIASAAVMKFPGRKRKEAALTQ